MRMSCGELGIHIANGCLDLFVIWMPRERNGGGQEELGREEGRDWVKRKRE